MGKDREEYTCMYCGKDSVPEREQDGVTMCKHCFQHDAFIIPYEE